MASNDPARWHRIDAVFAAALDAPHAERDQVVSRLCDGDEGLATEVKALLAESAAAARYWDHAGSRVLGGLARGLAEGREAEADAAGLTLGAYRLVRRLARGGMGTVYLGERADGRFEQQVAVKILRRGLDTEDVIARFLAERRVLASLDHPNIARLLDGGETPDGRPYLILELVDGRPLTVHADAERLSIPLRLRLFRQVGVAVQHAHRHLVVHRDLKPSNVLVTHSPAPQVKLLDFGIAKIVDLDDHTTGGTTRTAARMMTPGYASPEQVLGQPVTTASDVYQLGVLLYQLLTGTHPYPIHKVDPIELERLIVEHDPPPPSRRVDEAGAARRGTDARRLRKMLAGDVDRVTLMALRKEPDLRYASVEQFLEDLDHLERGLPVRAAAHTLRYRAARFVRRNRLGVAAALGALTLVAAHAVTLTVQNRRVAAQRDRAEAEARKATQVSEFMVRLFESANPEQTGGRDLSVREVLDLGARQARTDLADQPAERAALLSAVGRSYAALGQYTDARLWLERALRARRAAHGDVHELTAADLAELAEHIDTWDDQVALYRQALDVAEEAVGADHPLVARILTEFSVILSASPARDPETVRMRERAVGILRAAPEEFRGDLARALTVMAYGRPVDSAVALIGEALAVLREVYGEHHITVSESLNDLGLAMEAIDPLVADSLMVESLGITSAIMGEDHVATLGRLNNLAALRRDRGAFASAESTYRRILAIRRAKYPDLPVQLAYTTYGLGLVVTELGRPEEGEEYLLETLRLLRHGQVLEESPLYDLTRGAIGYALFQQGRLPEAAQYLLPAADRLVELTRPSLDLIRLLEWAASLVEASGRPEEAERYRRKAAEVRSAM